MLRFNLFSLSFLVTIIVIKSEVIIELNEELVPNEIPGTKNEIEWELNLSCKVTSDTNKNPSVKWTKDDKEIVLKEGVSFSNDGNLYNLTIKKATKDDVGSYDCVVKSDEELSKRSANLIGISVPNTMKITEGDKLQIQCLVFGGPPELSWKIDDSDVTADNTRVRLLADDDGIHKAILLIDSALQNDTAKYTCIGKAGGRVIEKTADVTVIDPNAALFPFLCICAEVVILCVIIFIFEKRYKKRSGIGGDTVKK